MGLSRKLADTLHLYSMDGMGGFIEEFVPSLAVEADMTVVSIPIREFGDHRYLIWLLFQNAHCQAHQEH